VYFFRWYIRFIAAKEYITIMAVDWNEGQLTPAGKATAEDSAGSGFLPRKLKRCPRKATVRRGNQHILHKCLIDFVP